MQFIDQGVSFFGSREQLADRAVAGRICPVARCGTGIFPNASVVLGALVASDPDAVRFGTLTCSDHVVRPVRVTGGGGFLSGQF
jgi:hypothetical protein